MQRVQACGAGLSGRSRGGARSNSGDFVQKNQVESMMCNGYLGNGPAMKRQEISQLVPCREPGNLRYSFLLGRHGQKSWSGFVVEYSKLGRLCMSGQKLFPNQVVCKTCSTNIDLLLSWKSDEELNVPWEQLGWV